MSYTVEIDKISQNDWEVYAKLFDDYSIYQTWPYQENRAKLAGQEVKRIIIKNKDEICLMGHIRIQKVPLLPIKIGYIQNGPLMRKNGIMPSSLKEIMKALTHSLFQNGINVVRIVPNIVADEVGSEFEKDIISIGFCKSVKKNAYHTFLVDTNDSEDGIRSRLRKSFRRDLKKAEKAGLEVKQGYNERLFQILADLYKQSKGRKGFDGLEIEEFNTPQSLLSESEKMKVLVAFYEDKPASALLSAEKGDRSIVLLAASNEIGLEKGSSYLLWYQACISAHNKGLKWCDLGGIDPENNPNVYKFKSRLGGKDIYHVGCYDIFKSATSMFMMKLIENIKG